MIFAQVLSLSTHYFEINNFGPNGPWAVMSHASLLQTYKALQNHIIVLL